MARIAAVADLALPGFRVAVVVVGRRALRNVLVGIPL
jgi:hypothetical protein